MSELQETGPTTAAAVEVGETLLAWVLGHQEAGVSLEALAVACIAMGVSLKDAVDGHSVTQDWLLDYVKERDEARHAQEE